MFVIAGETLVDMIETLPQSTHFQAVTGGAPYNVARALRSLGAPQVGYLSPISMDSFGDLFWAEMAQLGITPLSARVDAPCGLAVVRKNTSNQPSYSFYREDAADRQITPDIFKNIPQDSVGFYVGGLALASGPEADIWARLLEEIKIPIFVDPNIRPSFIPDRTAYLERLERVYRCAMYVKLSDEDISWLAPGILPEDYIQNLMARYPIRAIFLTGGAKGACVLHADKKFETSAPVITVADTVGAGDCFSAAVMASLLRAECLDYPDRADWGGILKYAVHAAAINCTRIGASMPTHAEVLEFMK